MSVDRILSVEEGCGSFLRRERCTKLYIEYFLWQFMVDLLTGWSVFRRPRPGMTLLVDWA